MNQKPHAMEPGDGLSALVAERLAELPLADLAKIGRPSHSACEPAFKELRNGLFIYEVKGKRIPAAKAKRARELASRIRVTGNNDPNDTDRLELAKLFVREVALSRATVAANAARRLIASMQAEAADARA